jgi:hypothetical protein
MLVIRLKMALNPQDIDYLNKKFARIVKSGEMIQRDFLPEETDHLDLPRLVFHHTRNDYGIFRQLINEINNC